MNDTVKQLKLETPEAILDSFREDPPSAFIVVSLHGNEEVRIAGRWRNGRIEALGMLAHALLATGRAGGR